MSIIFICHETGRTNSLIAIARKMLGKTTEEIIFLLVGKAAMNLFINILPANDPLKKAATIVTLADFFETTEIDHIEDNPLTTAQRDKITAYLASKKINKLLIGAPSWHQALAPFQIAEALIANDTDRKLNPQTAFILDGDYYKESGCAFWSVLEKPDTQEHAWRKQFTWLASLNNSKDEIRKLKLNPPLQVTVIGDTSIDKAVEGKLLTKDQANNVRKDLVNDNQVLLFVSGTKIIKDDEELLKLLLNGLTDDTIQIRFSIHKGTLDTTSHVHGLLKAMEKHPRANNVKILVSNHAITPPAREIYESSYVQLSPHDFDHIAATADGLACAIPGTHFTKAAISGLPTYHTKHKSYLLNTRYYTGDQLNSFLTSTRQKTRLPTLTKAELELPLERSDDMVAGMLLR
jgi:hypothetical protein